MTLHYTAGAEDAGRTLFSVLRYRLKISAGQIKRLKYQTCMLVNGTPVHTDYRVCPGDEIELPLPEEHASFPPEPGELKILYEDEALIALHKPAGIIMHPSATRNTGTLANQLLFYLGGGTVHPVNRLDRDTTGVTVFAKNGYVKSVLTEALRTANIHKTYLAPVYGRLPEVSGVIELPIDREQTVLMRLLPIPPLMGEPGDALQILHILENNMSSRLFNHVREDNALAYSVGVKFAGGFHPGVFAFSAATTPGGIPGVDACFDAELARLGAGKVTAEEFNAARDTLLFRIARVTESVHALLDHVLLDMFYGEPMSVGDEVIRRIKACTPEHFNDILRKIFAHPVAVTVKAGKLE